MRSIEIGKHEQATLAWSSRTHHFSRIIWHYYCFSQNCQTCPDSGIRTFNSPPLRNVKLMTLECVDLAGCNKSDLAKTGPGPASGCGCLISWFRPFPEKCAFIVLLPFLFQPEVHREGKVSHVRPIVDLQYCKHFEMSVP